MATPPPLPAILRFVTGANNCLKVLVQGTDRTCPECAPSAEARHVTRAPTRKPNRTCRVKDRFGQARWPY
jgi:hypothetical protein